MQEKPEIVNNKEEIPWEHYKAQFEKIDPEETASADGLMRNIIRRPEALLSG